MSAVLKAQSAIHPGNRIYRSRKRVNFFLLAVSSLALAFGLFWLVWILGVLLYEGAPHSRTLRSTTR